jgi:ankyrin repeat protein
MSNLLESTETFNTKELHDLCDNVKYKSKEGRFDRIRQWLNTNKDDNDRMKAGITYQGILKQTPLHRLLYRYHQLDIIQAFITFFPEVVNMKDATGSLPIHVACTRSNSLEVVQALVSASPDSIKVVDDHGEVPLHIACYWFAKLGLLNFLIESYPEGIDHKNKNEETPLDILKQNKYAERKVDNGMLRLHHVCINGYSLHLIHFLIQAYPESTTVQDNDGNTPLQYLTITASRVDEKGMLLLHREAAHFKGLNVEMLPILFHANPEAIRLQDKSGLLPIHHASLNQVSSLDALMLLVKLYPESIEV